MEVFVKEKSNSFEIYMKLTINRIDEGLIYWESAFLNLFFYHFLVLLSTNLLILFRIFHTIAENFKEVRLTIFIIEKCFPLIPSLSSVGREEG